MTTLGALAFNVAAGSSLGFLSLFGFGVGVVNQNEYIAPRCSARPKQVIYNPAARKGHPQYRGSPLWGWIPWTLSLSYNTLLEGIPGTGTRKRGLAGSLLKCNLDAIVLLRFHAMALKIAAVATVLCIGILFPMYWTSECHNSEAPGWEIACASNSVNLTSYERTTIASVPDSQDNIEDHTVSDQRGTILRLYFTVIVFWVITGYVLHLLKREWIEILALRRVHYLENDVWGERREQLKETLLYDELQTRDSPNGNANYQQKQQAQEPHLFQRKPWIPHPEQNETVSNIQLYSVLVGGLPSLPDKVITAAEESMAASKSKEDTQVQGFSKRDSVDWQLALTAAFFDHCVPNQPGFSSSVAAVTVLPSSKNIALAWSKWYKAAGKLRRLRFIRSQIAKRLHYDIEDVSYYPDEDNEARNAFDGSMLSEAHSRQRAETPSSTLASHPAGGWTTPHDRLALQTRNTGKVPLGMEPDPSPPHTMETPRGVNNSLNNSNSVELYEDEMDDVPQPIYQRRGTPYQEYYKQVLHHDKDYAPPPQPFMDDDYSAMHGSHYEMGDESHPSNHAVLNTNHFGPEQTAIYSREFAQSAAACCPNGCWEGAILDATIDELMEMEKEAAASVHMANLNLWKARRQAMATPHDDGNEMLPPLIDSGVSNQASGRGKPSSQHINGQGTSQIKNGEPGRANMKPTKKSLGSEKGILRTDSVESSHASLPNQPDSMTRSRQFAPSSMKNTSSGPQNTISSVPAFRNPNTKAPHVNVSRDRMPSELLLEADIYGKQDRFAPPKPLGRHSRSQSSGNADHIPVKKPLGLHSRSKSTGRAPSNGATIPPRGSESIRNLARSRSFEDLEAFMSDDSEERSGLVAKNQHGDSAMSDDGTPRRGRSPRRERTGTALRPHHNLRVQTGNNNVAFAPLMSGDSTPHQAISPVKPKLSKWEQVQSIVSTTHKAIHAPSRPTSTRNSRKKSSGIQAISGEWKCPRISSICKRIGRIRRNTLYSTKRVTKTAGDAMDLSRESTFAIVTFTSRQAAVAARHCLADGRGTNRWATEDELPIPPLADAAACHMCMCRNCCRPVTLTIDNRQKNWRQYGALLLLASFYTLSAFPLALVGALVDPQKLQEVFPNLFAWAEEHNEGVTELVAGFVQSLIWTLFFALCPVFFRVVSNFGSIANSVAGAELKALHYFWWFMVVSAFSGTLIANMVLFGFNDGKLGGEFQTVLRSIARAIPSTTAATWLNWIIFRTSVSMPSLYLLQINTFLWDFLGCNCCSRLSRGGGPGPPPPYRLYVDSGMVLMCVLALAPASPLVAPAAFVYFLLCQPLLRRCCIFVYRPKFDGGGLRWIFIFDMVISGIFVGQILLTIQMVLKQAVGPALVSAAPILPTLLTVLNMKKQFMRPFRDAALLQTSLLDGWGDEDASEEKREEFRRFLVDAHKAAYIPVCLAGTDPKEATLTAEPAVVVPLESDFMSEIQTPVVHPDIEAGPMAYRHRNNSDENFSRASGSEKKLMERRSSQHGAVLRRSAPALNKFLSPANRVLDMDDDSSFSFAHYSVSQISISQADLGPVIKEE